MRISPMQPLQGPEGGRVVGMAVSNNRQYALTQSKYFWRDGASGPWRQGTWSPSIGWISGFFVHGDTLVGEGYSDSIYFSPDQGRNWDAFRLPGELHDSLLGSWAVGLGKYGLLVMAKGPGGHLFRTQDFGKTWRGYPGVGATNAVEWGGGLVVAHPQTGLNFLDVDSGVFSRMEAGLPPGIEVALSTDGSSLFAFGSSKGSYRYHGNTQSWQRVDVNVDSLWEHSSVRCYGSEVLLQTWYSDGKQVFHRSGDGGATWSEIARFHLLPIDGLIPSNDGYLAFGQESGIYRVTPDGLDLVPDNAGLHATELTDLAIQGKRIFGTVRSSGTVHGTEDLGHTWITVGQKLASGTTYLSATEKDVFYHRSGFLARLGMLGWEPLAPLPGSELMGLKDGGDRFYAHSQTKITRGAFHYLGSSPKSDSGWTQLPIPSKNIETWSVSGTSLLINGQDGTHMSRDGGLSWKGMEGFPYDRVRGIDFAEGLWLVSTDRGIFSSIDPSGPWSAFAFTSAVTVMAYSGKKMVVKVEPFRFMITMDFGEIWSEIILPSDPSRVSAVHLSDSLLCLGREVEFYCSDLATLPISVRGRPSARKDPASPLRFQGAWQVILAPGVPGGRPRTFDFQGRMLEVRRE